ncbi:hypothetical protein DSO57_1029188 [Entomophthora muscae]|uniref:Uncharacterized protein n=1 Tax=Entomophthora muscae TaxID=34485 RepID=A0ACC2SEK9_9FUNG|nr:hypothetical protein DSO57_1029188 [Entomophthora muscae]
MSEATTLALAAAVVFAGGGVDPLFPLPLLGLPQLQLSINTCRTFLPLAWRCLPQEGKCSNHRIPGIDMRILGAISQPEQGFDPEFYLFRSWGCSNFCLLEEGTKLYDNLLERFHAAKDASSDIISAGKLGVRFSAGPGGWQ